MPSIWTNTIAAQTPIRASDVQELRDAINHNRTAGGLASYSWTDPTLYAQSTPVQATHYTQMRTAIQDLWTRKSMGALPAWTGGTPAAGSPIRASDMNDLRSWLNQYETTAAFTGPKRGIHLRNAGDLWQVDLDALAAFRPGMVVVLSTDVARPAMLNYLKSIQNTAEIFIRHVPPSPNPVFSYAPVVGHTSLDGSYPYTKNYEKPAQKDPTDVANEIIAAANNLKAQGLTNFRWFAGNEPELEWTNDAEFRWRTQFWLDVKHYYSDIYDELVRLGRPCEIYPPAFDQHAAFAVDSPIPMTGSIPRAGVGTEGKKTFEGLDTDYGVHHCVEMIDRHTNGGPAGIGRFLLHNYFWPGRHADHWVYNFWPQFLKDRRTQGMPVRIPEWGWTPDAVKTGQCPSLQCCPANLDTTTTSCDGAITNISAAKEYNDFVRMTNQFDGCAVWLLSDASNTFPYFAGVREDGTVREWLRMLIAHLDA